jgi:protein-tyrosine phosphatase
VSSWFRTYGFQDVQDGFLVGAYPLDDRDVGMLERAGVGRIVNLVDDSEYAPGEREAVERALAGVGIEERRWGMPDYGHIPREQLEGALADVASWLDEGRCVYLHCRAGWQRSAAVAAAVVAIREGVDIEEALLRVRQRKPSADPLAHQRDDLARWWSERESA